MNRWTDLLDDLVRMLVTLAFTGALVWGFYMKIVNADTFIGIAGLAIGFWFSGKGNNNAPPTPPTPGK